MSIAPPEDRVDGEATVPNREFSARRRTIPHLRTRARLFLRHNIRDSQLGLTVVAAAIGVVIAFGVALTRNMVDEFHHFLFGVPIEQHISGALSISSWRILLVPSLGGLAYGLIAFALRRRWPRDIVDAIEANALHGGRMSLTDSVRLTVMTIISAGVGASVGLEAAYTQLGAGTASRIGRMLHLRRNDLRNFVGCGAAAAIAAAFNAPLCGAFYAFELIIGSYTLATLVPVVVAALMATMVTRDLFGEQPIFIVYSPVDLHAASYLIMAVIGVVAGMLSIAAMLGVTYVEQGARRLSLPVWLRPAAGGLLLGVCALGFPEILGSGHGGIVHMIATGSTGFTLWVLLGLIFFKTVGSALSIGSGFRGGMFSSSLYLGSIYGAACSLVIHRYLPWAPPDEAVFVLAGMGSVAAGIVGAPMTMIFLVLEATTDFSATMGVTVAVIAAALVVRHCFGYSFATWRFHLRGVALHSPHDIGWLHDLRVAKLMRQDFAVVPPQMPLADLCRQFPITDGRRVFVADEQGGYEGYIDLIDAHGTELVEGEPLTVNDVARGADDFLMPGQPVRETLDRFIESAAEVLAVVDNPRDRHLLGYLSEAYALRRYYRELEARHRDELGDEALFNATHAPEH
ncbi:MAG TPA: chloride channel protein [Stellaceae bacterium]|nr:chloride channel protein [Stellaceae bacterium]